MPLCDMCIDYLHQNNASKLLLAIMESRHDSENAERILSNMRTKQLVSFVHFDCVQHFKPIFVHLICCL